MGGVDKGKFESGGGWCELDENENEIGKWNGYVFYLRPTWWRWIMRIFVLFEMWLWIDCFKNETYGDGSAWQEDEMSLCIDGVYMGKNWSGDLRKIWR